jgi:hypothetical protein
MPTSNVVISSSWVKIAESSNAELLATWSDPAVLEVATTATDSAPTVQGHKLTREGALTRGVIGAGFVWAKLSAGTKPNSVLLVVSK